MTQDKPLILLFQPDASLAEVLAVTLERSGFRVARVANAAGVLQAIHADPPACLIVAYTSDNPAAHELITEMKSDNVYGHLPMILIIDSPELSTINWQAIKADDYLLNPPTREDLLARVNLCIARSLRDINANPLTGLPGNLTIMREAEQRLEKGEHFALAYLDLDHFKPFNDKYGFSRGDEVLRMTARILVNAIRNLKDTNAYVGHVGGDDFVFITPPDRIETACQEVCRNFDLIIPNFYDEEDVNDGGIHSIDRQNNPQFFPIMSCSLAVVDTRTSGVSHLADISARAAEVKKVAKGLIGSNYVIDRRR